MSKKESVGLMQEMTCQEKKCINGGTIEQSLLDIIVDTIKGVFILKA